MRPPNRSSTPKVTTVKVGDVYKAKGGSQTAFWLVIRVTPGLGIYALGMDKDGELVSTTHYAAHVFERRELVGRVENFKLKLDASIVTGKQIGRAHV